MATKTTAVAATTTKPADLFGVAVRVLGLWWLSKGAWYASSALVPDPGHQPYEYLVAGVCATAIGVPLLFGSRFIVQFFYR
jgi:hypothetical protein